MIDFKRNRKLLAFLVLFIAVANFFLSQPKEIRYQGSSQEKQIRYEGLRNVASDEGKVKIVVKLWIPNYDLLIEESNKYPVIEPGQTLPDSGLLAGIILKEQIKFITNLVLERLKGTEYKVNHVYSSIPYVALDASSEALSILESLTEVLDMEEDKPLGLIEPVLDGYGAKDAFAGEEGGDPPSLNNTVSLIGADTAWGMGFTGSGWHVAILDTGIRSTHEFFLGKNIVEACFAQGETGSGDCPNGDVSMTGPGSAVHYESIYEGWDHGTHVSGIATGNNGSLFGVAKDADIIAVKVFSRFADCDSNTAGDQPCVMSWNSDLLAGLDYVYSLRGSYSISSVNLSLGGGAYSSPCDSDPRKAVIDNLRAVGIATAIATGNNGYCGYVNSPACISSSVAVGSSTDSDDESWFNNWHATMQKFFAPGSSVYSATGDSDTSYESWSGTSMATPHVAGAWALLKHAMPAGTVTEFMDALRLTGIGITSSCDGHNIAIPRIQVDAAIDGLSGSVTITSPNGGESWVSGGTEAITWTTAGVTSPLIIMLLKDGSWVGNIAYNVDPGLGTYTWTVGQLKTGTAPVGTGYKVKIQETGTSVFDRSDNSFSIISSQPIVVTSPNGGESWVSGATEAITWTAAGVSGPLTIMLLKDGSWVGNIAYNVDPGLGAYAWTVGQLKTGTAPAGTGYKVKIQENGTSVFDRSDVAFTITASSSIAGKSSNRGENAF